MLRPSLIPGMLSAIVGNERYFDDFCIFESAQVFEPGEYHPSLDDETHKRMEERLSLLVKDTAEAFECRCDFEIIHFFKVKNYCISNLKNS